MPLVECRFVGFNDAISLYRSDILCSFSIKFMLGKSFIGLQNFSMLHLVEVVQLHCTSATSLLLSLLGLQTRED